MNHIETRKAASAKARRAAAKLTTSKAASLLEKVAATMDNEQDRADLNQVAHEIKAACVPAAMAYARTLDTAVREEIPAAVWAYMGGEFVYE